MSLFSAAQDVAVKANASGQGQVVHTSTIALEDIEKLATKLEKLGFRLLENAIKGGGNSPLMDPTTNKPLKMVPFAAQLNVAGRPSQTVVVYYNGKVVWSGLEPKLGK